MRIGLTDKGALSISNYLFDEIIKKLPGETEESICSSFILMAMEEEAMFFDVIKNALLNIGMELMKNEEA